MVDHLSRVKLLTLKLGLRRESKRFSETLDFTKLEYSKRISDKFDSLENDRCPVNYLTEVEMRSKQDQTCNNLTVVHDDNDEVFNAGDNDSHFPFTKKGRKPIPAPRTSKLTVKAPVDGIVEVPAKSPVQQTPKSPLNEQGNAMRNFQMNLPIVNKRLTNIKRPLEATKSMPLSSAALPDRENLKEDNLRGDIDFLCGEMVNLRQKDQDIAKFLLQIYSEIQKLKVKRSCLLHKELLEEATYDAAEAEDVPDMCDAPQKYMSKILLSRGVTKQNLAWRRFSCS